MTFCASPSLVIRDSESKGARIEMMLLLCLGYCPILSYYVLHGPIVTTTVTSFIPRPNGEIHKDDDGIQGPVFIGCDIN
ncbi:unnamed protein product [Calypogeia fissa]